MVVGLVAAGLLSVGAGPAGAVIPSGNLLVNPGAEAGGADPGGASTGAVSGWTVGSQSPAVVRYGTAGGFPSSPSPSVAGGQFFAGGSTTPDSGSSLNKTAMNQFVSTSSTGAQSEIDAGNVQATLSGCLGGYADQDDYVSISLNATDGIISVPLAGSPVNGPSASQRSNQTKLLPVSLTAPVLANSTALESVVTFTRESGLHTYNDGYADNLQLILSPAGSTAPAPLPCPGQAASSPSGGGHSGSGATTPGKLTAAAGTNPAAGISRVGKALTLKGRYALVKLRCTLHDGSCKGTLGLTTTDLPKAKATAAKKAKATKLGSAKFRIAKGRTQTVKVKIKRSIRKRLSPLSKRRLKKLKITATAKVGSQTTKFTLGAVRKH
jgi:CxxC motif-containing protein